MWEVCETGLTGRYISSLTLICVFLTVAILVAHGVCGIPQALLMFSSAMLM